MDIRKRFKTEVGVPLHEKQILLVGSNPLPVALTAMALRPRDGVWLVYTREVAPRASRLARLLGTKGISTHKVPLTDGYGAVAVQSDLEQMKGLCREAGLGYTGGTKVVATQTYAFWQRHGGQPAQASYLGSDTKLRFDEGGPVMSLRDEPRLTLRELCELHMDWWNEPSNEHLKSDGSPNSARAEAAKLIHARVAKTGFDAYKGSMLPLYDNKATISLVVADGAAALSCSYNAAELTNFKDTAAFTKWLLPELRGLLGASGDTIDAIGERLRGQPLPAENSEKRQRRRLDDAKWLWGEWLEVWLAELLAGMKSDDAGVQPLFDEIHQNIDLKDRFQVDVVAVRGATAYLFSCTVDKSRSLLKSKLFEAVQRASQLGGDHARVALVSFADSPKPILEEIREEGWQGFDDAQVFGAVHVKDPERFAGELRKWILRSDG